MCYVLKFWNLERPNQRFGDGAMRWAVCLWPRGTAWYASRRQWASSGLNDTVLMGPKQSRGVREGWMASAGGKWNQENVSSGKIKIYFICLEIWEKKKEKRKIMVFEEKSERTLTRKKPSPLCYAFKTHNHCPTILLSY